MGGKGHGVVQNWDSGPCMISTLQAHVLAPGPCRFTLVAHM